MMDFEAPFDLSEEWVKEEVQTLDTIIEDYPKLKASMTRSKEELLRDPVAYFDRQAAAVAQLHNAYPAIGRLLLE